MNASLFSARLGALPLALAAAFPCSSFAQAPGSSLPETVVTATRFLEPAQSLPIGVSVITAEEIRASGATTVSEALVRVLGISSKQDLYGAGDSSLDLRGFGENAGSNQVVIVDGLRLNDADSGAARLSGVPVDAVERIEVLRGSGAVLYGEGATGGVIVITTKAGLGKDRINRASVQVGAGSDRLRDVRASATVAGGGFSLDVHGQKRDTDNHRDNFRSESDTASVTGQWTNDWLRLGARHSRDDVDAGLPGGLSLEAFRSNPRQSSSPLDRASVVGERSGVFGEALLGGWQLAADAAVRTQEVRSAFLFGTFTFNVDKNIEAKTLGLRARNEADLSFGKNIFVIGHDNNRWQIEDEGANVQSATQRAKALYAKNDLVLPIGTRLSIGARTERIDKEDAVSATGVADRQRAWELGASQALTKDLTVYGRLGRSFRLPSVDEFTFTAPGVSLVPQSSRDVELGARWTLDTLKLDGRLYRSTLTNEIGFDPAVFTGSAFFLGANVNFDPTRRQGIELDARQSLSRTVTLRVNAAVRQSEFRAGPYAGNEVPLAARRTLAVRADWAPAAAHRLSGGVNWVSSQQVDIDNTCSIPSYATADARYAYQWQKLELSFGVGNLFDRKFFSQAFACAGGEATAVYPEPGRKFVAAARIQF